MMRLAFGLLAALLYSNEASRMLSKRRLALAEKRKDAEAMPMDRALDILSKHPSTSDDLVSFVQARVHHHRTHHRHQKKAKHLRKKGIPNSKPDAGADYTGGTQSAVVRINEMLLETINKRDEEELRCEGRFEELEQLLTEIAEDLNAFSVASTEANARKLDAYAEISDYGVFITQTRGELQEHDHICESEARDLHSQLAIVKKDMGVMEKILAMTECKDKDASEGADATGGGVLLECTDGAGHNFTRIKPSKEVAEQFKKLQHASSRELLSKQVLDVRDAAVLLQNQASRALPNGLYGSMNATNEAVTYPDQQAKCSASDITDSSHCPELRERFLNIAGGIADAVEELELMIGNQQKKCSEIRSGIEREIEHFQIYLRQQQQKEAQASADYTDAQTGTTKKELQQRETSQTLREEKDHCQAAHKEYKSEECALNKIRDQLLEMSDLERHIVDCEVTTPWEYGECTSPCAGGTRTLTRDVDVQPGPGPELWQKGHLCPAIKAVQQCNTERCPVDCELSEWGEWGSCSKVCDGGTRERMRSVVQAPVAGGLRCPTKIETEDCNLQACKKDCVLGDWSEWSTTCSKQCGTGQQTRFKTLVAPAEAGGKCAHFYDQSRFNTKPCNEAPCPYSKNWVTCRAKVDIVLLIDGSASMGTDGFTHAKTFAANFANALSAPAQVATLVFSGPDSISTMNICEGVTQGDATIAQCGMNWINHMSSDFATVATGINEVAFPAQSALTSMAVNLAASEFMLGHQTSQSIAILLTDGMPTRKYPMKQATEHLKQTARFMEIVVGRDAYADASLFKEWASAPWSENVRFVNEWADLTSSNDHLNGVIESFCADMVFES